MPRPAKNLHELLLIRAHEPNRRYLEEINENLGSALGFKKRTNQGISPEPAVIVFVKEKIHRKWIPGEQLIKSDLEPVTIHGEEVFCPLDVIAGGRPNDQPTKPTESGSALAQRMRGWDDHIWVGSQIETMNEKAGTIGLFVKRGTGANIQYGFITALHVVGQVNDLIYHPRAAMEPLGTAIEAKMLTSMKEWYGVEGFPSSSMARVDYAFVKLFKSAYKHLVPQSPVDPPGEPTDFGPRFDIDLDAEMVHELPDGAKVPHPDCVIGQEVIHVGRTSGRRQGKIHAFAYEWLDKSHKERFADLLIGPETTPLTASGSVELSVGFSDFGDSGSLVFTKNGKRPVAMLWGGRIEQLRGGETQENWTYATRLDKILDTLKATPVTQFPAT